MPVGLTHAGEGQVVEPGDESAHYGVGPLEEKGPGRVNDDPVEAVDVPAKVERASATMVLNEEEEDWAG